MRKPVDVWRRFLQLLGLSKDHDNSDRIQFQQLTEAICSVACALRESTEQRRIEFEWAKSHHGFATKHDLVQMEQRIMATQTEIIADLKAAIVSLKQVNVDIKDTQTAVTELKTKIVELEALVAAGGTIGSELVEAVAEVKSLAQAADEALPNAVVVPPPVV